MGYGASFVATEDRRAATISVDYADGWFRSLRNCGAAYFKGVKLPFLRRVSMDSVTIDISDLPEGALSAGDFVDLIGDHQTLADVAGDAQTIGNEILTSLGRRHERFYVSGRE